MRKSAAVLALFLMVLGLAACGGGSSNTDPTTSPTATTATPAEPAASGPEATWAKEVTAVMSTFENQVSANMLPTIQDTYNQTLLEPLYRTYGGTLAQLAQNLEATKAPAACAAAQKRIATAAHHVAHLTEELSRQSHLSQQKYALLLERQGRKIQHWGRELTTLTASPHC